MTDKKLTDAEIVNAFKCCLNGWCDDCPVRKTRELCHSIDYLILDLITRQKAELERLKVNLNVELENFASEYDNKIKAEAIKEFAEKLKRKRPVSISGCTGWVDFDAIDNLVKEMTE